MKSSSLKGSHEVNIIEYFTVGNTRKPLSLWVCKEGGGVCAYGGRVYVQGGRVCMCGHGGVGVGVAEYI